MRSSNSDIYGCNLQTLGGDLLITGIVEDYDFPNLAGISFIRMTQDGDIKWSKRYRLNFFVAILNQPILTMDGQILVLLVTANYTNATSSDPNDLTENNILLLKMNADGDITQQFKIGDNGGLLSNLSSGYDIAEDRNGNYILMVHNLIHKIDRNGNLIWTKFLSFGTDYLRKAVLPMPNGNLMVLGEKTNTVLFPDETNHTVITLLDENGNHIQSSAMNGIRPLHLYNIHNNQILLTGYTLGAFRRPHLFVMDMNANILRARMLPVFNRTKRRNIISTSNGEIAMHITDNKETLLVRLDEEMNVKDARSYASNNKSYYQLDEWGRTLVALEDGGFAMLNNYAIGFDSPLIIRTDALGAVGDCYSARSCIDTESVDIPDVLSVNVDVQNISYTTAEILRSLNGVVENIEVKSQPFCTKIESLSPYFTLPDTICENTPITPDALCQAQADTWRWEIEGQ
ncbi:MAG: hypothetical protein AAF738_08790, partial [Bacteroidota bacterium]